MLGLKLIRVSKIGQRDDIMAAGGLVMQKTWASINRYGMFLECGEYLIWFNSITCMRSNETNKMGSAYFVIFGSVFIFGLQ